MMATRPNADGGPVFGHGQLRLYLLAVLEEGPRSGYDVIRGLEDRFGGLYSPSAGTVYPRLAKLEEEGLVTRSDEGRRSTYALTESGRAELDGRRDELAELEASLDESAQRLAEQMRERVRTGAADVRARLEEAARQARARARASSPTSTWGPPESGAPQGSDASAGAGTSGGPGAGAGAGHAAPGGSSRGSGPFVPPAFGSGFPFGQGGTPDWAAVARWLGDVGITPPGSMSGAWGDWVGGRGGSGRPGSADPGASGSERAGDASSGSGGSGGSGTAGVWADATDRVDTTFSRDAGSSDPSTERAAAAPDGGEPQATPAEPHDTGTGWPDTVEASGAPAHVDPAPGAVSDPPHAPGSGSGRRGRSEWEDFLGGGIPDAAQLREIGEIVRDAATRIQGVLARSRPDHPGSPGPEPTWPERADGPDETAGGDGPRDL